MKKQLNQAGYVGNRPRDLFLAFDGVAKYVALTLPYNSIHSQPLPREIHTHTLTQTRIIFFFGGEGGGEGVRFSNLIEPIKGASVRFRRVPS